jgi:hypothetical protein
VLGYVGESDNAIIDPAGKGTAFWCQRAREQVLLLVKSGP